MAQKMDSCPHCGSILASEASPDDVAFELRMPCTNPDCPGKWTATQFGGAEGVRQSYDVPGLSGAAVARGRSGTR